MPQLDLTPDELAVLNVIMGFHEDDEPNEHYRFDAYETLAEKTDALVKSVRAKALGGHHLNQTVDAMMAVTQKPFDNRLEATLYLAMAEAVTSVTHGDKERTLKVAKRIASMVQDCVYCDVDRKP